VTRPGRERHDRLPRVDRQPGVEAERRVGLVHLGERLPHGKSGPHGAFRIVAVGGGSAEDAHDRVADELLDRTAETLDFQSDPLVIRREDCEHVLGVELLGASRGADEVDEEHADDASFLLRPSRLGEGGPAPTAVPRVAGVLVPAP